MVLDHDIWGEETLDDPLQDSKTKFHMRSMSNQQLLKIVEKMAKKRLFLVSKKWRFVPTVFPLPVNDSVTSIIVQGTI